MLQKTETNTIRQSINYIFDKMNAFHSTLDNFNKYGHLFIFCFVLFFRSVMPTQIKQIMRFFDPLNKISIYYVEKYIVQVRKIVMSNYYALIDQYSINRRQQKLSPKKYKMIQNKYYFIQTSNFKQFINIFCFQQYFKRQFSSSVQKLIKNLSIYNKIMVKKTIILLLVCIAIASASTSCNSLTEYLSGNKCLCKDSYYKISGICSTLSSLNYFLNKAFYNRCPENAKYSYYKQICQCKAGFVPAGSQCIIPCKPNAVYYSTLKACLCNNGFTLDVNGNCVVDVVGNVVLQPADIAPSMFTSVIDGSLNKLRSYRVNGQDVFEIDMVRAKVQILPAGFPQSGVFAYAGQLMSGSYMASYPGPSIWAEQGVAAKVTYHNKIFGPHMFPIDVNPPFINSTVFTNEVPCVPHLHGVRAKQTSDGHPEAYWTALGNIGARYATEQPIAIGSAVYRYPNKQEPTTLWYHDHTMGETRLNVYAGLASFYEIETSSKRIEQKVIDKLYNQVLERKFFAINDKTFKANGDLYYHDLATNLDFTYWTPEFFGNTMVVNGKVWPRVNLAPGKHRFVLLNACQARIMNIFFLHNGAPLPFDIIRLDGNYYSTPVTVSNHVFALSSRIEIIIDLSGITGDVVLTNDANAPFPGGDPIDPLTANIMKIVVDPAYASGASKYQSIDYTVGNVINPTPYPAFAPGIPIYKTIIEVANAADQVAAGFINGVGFKLSQQCITSTYKIGQTYDWHIINLTGDTHPIHVHLINFQLVARYAFDADAYLAQWQTVNGVTGPFGQDTFPDTFDPTPYYTTGTSEPIAAVDKVFRDVVNADTGYVTVIRVKFAGNDGNPFGFNASGMSFVWHCHILEHEDNDMMNYYCLE